MDKDTKDINGGVRVGISNTSIRIGNQLIAGKEFDIKQLVDNITFADDLVHEEINAQLVLICNLSSIPIYLFISRFSKN